MEIIIVLYPGQRGDEYSRDNGAGECLKPKIDFKTAQLCILSHVYVWYDMLSPDTPHRTPSFQQPTISNIFPDTTGGVVKCSSG